jgi:hypothetical protein
MPALNEKDNSLIADVASKQLGVPPQAAQQSAPPAPPPDAAPTKQEVAQEQLAPSTEGDRQGADATEILRVKFGDQERELTPEQIKGTFDRYSALNYKHQSMKPVLDLADKMLAAAKKKNPNVTAKDLAKFMTAASKAQTHNPKMGESTQTPETANQSAPTASSEEIDAQLKQWEDDNAVSLPPRFRETMSGMDTLRSENKELRDMLMKVIDGQQKVTSTTQKQLDATDQREGKVIQQRIGNNLAAVQQALKLPDEAEQEFIQFAYSRGYTMEDFIDPQLALTVGKDYQAVKDSPELDRLREVQRKRQAFTGNAGATPAGGAQQPASNPDQTFIDAIANKTFNQRGM